MIRTQISLSLKEYNLAKKVAKKSGVSLAEFFRRSLRSALPIDTKNSWMKYQGMVASGNKNSSVEIDDIVYGTKD